MASSDTRERIMETAIAMFNSLGLSNVSTVQIAGEMGISPSNLYYYFENKEHLIRAIWTEKIAPTVAAIFYDDEVEKSESGIIKFLTKFSMYIIQYRFFYLELQTILVSDPELKLTYSERAAVLMKRVEEFMGTWTKLDILRELPVVEKKLLLENMWIISQTFTSYIKLIRQDSSPDELAMDSVVHIYSLLRPYLTPEANARIIKLLKISSNDIPNHVLESFAEISGLSY